MNLLRRTLPLLFLLVLSAVAERPQQETEQQLEVSRREVHRRHHTRQEVKTKSQAKIHSKKSNKLTTSTKSKSVKKSKKSKQGRTGQKKKRADPKAPAPRVTDAAEAKDAGDEVEAAAETSVAQQEPTADERRLWEYYASGKRLPAEEPEARESGNTKGGKAKEEGHEKDNAIGSVPGSLCLLLVLATSTCL
eukprot:gb/GFBE01077272.1/.p1 GENE.gb/GFBE01077272.1/~~gb/GFBE01077272.1/.p1  ORF type:complete len:192 (+),score=39.31 gb/GFBE01077272.1/:1-576(+)